MSQGLNFPPPSDPSFLPPIGNSPATPSGKKQTTAVDTKMREIAQIRLPGINQRSNQVTGTPVVSTFQNFYKKCTYLADIMFKTLFPTKKELIINSPGTKRKIVISEHKLAEIKELEKLVNKDNRTYTKWIDVEGVKRPIHIFWVNSEGTPHVESYLGFNKNAVHDGVALDNSVLGMGENKKVLTVVKITDTRENAKVGQEFALAKVTVIRSEPDGELNPESKMKIQKMKDEVYMMNELNNTNPEICPRVEFLEYDHGKKHNICMLTEKGQDIDPLLKKGLSKENKKSLAYQMVLGIKTGHDSDKVFNDVKLGNFIARPATKDEKKKFGGDYHVWPIDLEYMKEMGKEIRFSTGKYTSPEICDRLFQSDQVRAAIKGKRSFMPPPNHVPKELQYEHQSHKEADAWALGVCLFQVFTGKQPPWFEINDIYELHKTFTDMKTMTSAQMNEYLGLDALKITPEEKEILKMALNPKIAERATTEKLLSYMQEKWGLSH